ncbi:metalloprotease [Methylorubrum populi]|uniref:metalloprotease n=1 Tax=Methylorubrum populi TaxID=223967 RepID=UPI000DB6E9D2|nr:metalloprotease [Methylorubrum populi]PZP69449.1 MAG: metalloprotease [Methylorubrum populi]
MFENGSEQIEPRSGNAQLDRALAQTLAKLSKTFDVLPGFAYYRDNGRPNALATPEVRLQRTDGTVLFGLEMLQMLLQRPEHPDASIVAVCAHEFGHIVGYKTRLIEKLAPNRRDPFRAEQHADYIAGFFAGMRKLERSDFPAIVFATTQQSFGGTLRGSHGTGQERGEAVLEGFKAAYERKVTPAEGIQLGFQYAMTRK